MGMKEVRDMKKQLITMAVVGTILGTGLLATNTIYAQTTTPTNPISSLVDKLATRFGLKPADVQSVFDQHRQERQAAMQAKFESRLTELVVSGKITEAQKQLILAKHKEMADKRQSEMQSFQTMTAEQRQAAMQQKRTERETERQALEKWATANGIDIQYLMNGMGMKEGRGFGRHL
jgi:hypothetical protein